MKKHIIFDFDGTLVDTFPIVMELLEKISPLYSLPLIPREDIEKYRQYGLAQLMKMFGISNLKLILIAFHIKYLLKKHLINVSLFPKVFDTLIKLHNNGYTILILSSNTKNNILKVLEYNNIDIPIKVYSKSSLFGKSKALRKILKIENIDIKDCVYVGDEVRDYISSKEIGMEFIGVSWGYNSPQALKDAGANIILDRFEDITKVV